ncbi:MAG TPA: SDR family NAD(P)-dependent oxidoreductase, partial [Geminicoccus sp.]|uniref:SDR family NAD(P)-dependent oxidoreductase n=1 Tax=Geminicoccus sp. TaxID=2024832 RepID=UPI002E2EF7DB
MERTLDGRIAIITGGTQGLGETTARLFAERGAAGLVLSGRNRERGEAVAKDLSAGGCRTVFVAGDLGDLDAVRQVTAAADSTFGKLHAL